MIHWVIYNKKKLKMTICSLEYVFENEIKFYECFKLVNSMQATWPDLILAKMKNYLIEVTVVFVILLEGKQTRWKYLYFVKGRNSLAWTKVNVETIDKGVLGTFPNNLANNWENFGNQRKKWNNLPKGLFGLIWFGSVLLLINHCRLFYAKYIFIPIYSPFSNNLVQHTYRFCLQTVKCKTWSISNNSI